jgi:hypothetical protein
LQSNRHGERHKNRTADGGLPAATGPRSGNPLIGARKRWLFPELARRVHPALDAGSNDNRKNLMPSFRCTGLKSFASGILGVSQDVADLLWTARMIAVGLSILAISPISAADEPCRSIKSNMARLACFDRAASSAQSSIQEARPATDRVGGAFVDPAEWLRAENDKVAARLKGICRGC